MPADLSSLVEHFLRCSATEVGEHVRGVTARVLEAMVRYPWPGNLRELENEVRRLVYRCRDGAAVDSAMLAPAILAATGSAARPATELDLKRQVDDLERSLILAALEGTGGNRSQTARLLGLSHNGLLLKLERLGIDG